MCYHEDFGTLERKSMVITTRFVVLILSFFLISSDMLSDGISHCVVFLKSNFMIILAKL
jgi:hypothetical protein